MDMEPILRFPHGLRLTWSNYEQNARHCEGFQNQVQSSSPFEPIWPPSLNLARSLASLEDWLVRWGVGPMMSQTTRDERDTLMYWHSIWTNATMNRSKAVLLIERKGLVGTHISRMVVGLKKFVHKLIHFLLPLRELPTVMWNVKPSPIVSLSWKRKYGP